MFQQFLIYKICFFRNIVLFGNFKDLAEIEKKRKKNKDKRGWEKKKNRARFGKNGK